MAPIEPTIPFLDLHKINEYYHEKFKMGFSVFLESGTYIKGAMVEGFEKAFAKFCGAKFCVGVGNGLDALTLILRGYIELGRIDKGDEVLVAANTYIATILSIKQAGLKPVLVEPDEGTFNLDPARIEKQISEKTKVILPTHLYGQLAPMKKINEIAKNHKILVISDAAQAHGAVDEEGSMAGNLCDATSFSFYPTKNLGGLGDGGAVTTNDKNLYEVVRSLGNYGSTLKYINDYEGVNSRLDTLQAVFLLEKLKHLDADNKKRIHIAKRYISEIKNEKIRLPLWNGKLSHVFHLFVVKVNDRKKFCDYLIQNRIGYLVHYPIPPHKQKALSYLQKLKLPITEKIHNEVVSIPLNIALTDADINRIIKVLNEY